MWEEVSGAHVTRLQDGCSICRDREAIARRAALQEIVSELSRTITRNGQRGIQRSFQALHAAVSISTEYLTNIQQGIQEPPQVCLCVCYLPAWHAPVPPALAPRSDHHTCDSHIHTACDTGCCSLQVILRKLFEKLGATYIKLGAPAFLHPPFS